jgi:hypothetical protein
VNDCGLAYQRLRSSFAVTESCGPWHSTLIALTGEDPVSAAGSLADAEGV